tara:strand:+ start:219 stop:560 length:342 start_codon:yes stop_codon:yes gene_type:complete
VNRFQRRRLADKRAGVAAIETIICSAASPVPSFCELEWHHWQSGSPDKSQVGVWPMVRRMNRCPLWRKTRLQARRDVFDYIEMFYNPKRKHVRNGMLSPVPFERQQISKNEGV